MGLFDALRGWAFLGVLLVHVQTILDLPPVLAQLARPANYGVQLFFVTSALTLAMSHESHPAAINAVVPGGWSIAVEMNFYLILPYCSKVIRTLRGSLIACAVVFDPSVMVIAAGP